MDLATADGTLEIFEVGPCVDGQELGFLIGQKFADQIRSRVANDLILRDQLRPFADTLLAQPLLQALFDTNKEKFPRYWDELLGTAAGSGVSVLDILLLNFRKEILPFLPKEGSEEALVENSEDDCSDILVMNESIALIGHNEDAKIALVGHTYLVNVKMPDGLSFTAYTYAGELPSCAFGFNIHGVGFTLDSVPPANKEILQGGIGRNFVSRDLLEANSLVDALQRIRRCNVSVGHSYNLFSIRSREMVNVETASDYRMSVRNIGVTPFFHANRFLHLQVAQVHDENSISREQRAANFTVSSVDEMKSLLGDSENKVFPIYMTGPVLYTLCTAIFDLDGRTLSIIRGNPKEKEVSCMLKLL